MACMCVRRCVCVCNEYCRHEREGGREQEGEEKREIAQIENIIIINSSGGRQIAVQWFVYCFFL